MGINVLSLFDGISCGMIALEKAGVKVDNYFASEINKHAELVSKDNYPDIIRLGDIRNWKDWNLPKIDLIIAGSPCQGFSNAGKKGGTKAILNGEEIIVSSLEQYKELKDKEIIFLSQSYLFWEFVYILDELKKKGEAKKILLENVSMSKENMEMISEALGVEPIEINSNLFLPQNRKRFYWTNIEFENEIKDKRKLDFIDILDYGYTPKKNSSCLLEGHSRPNKDKLRLVRRDLEKSLMPLVYESKEKYELLKEHYEKNYKGKSAEEVNVLRNSLNNEIYNSARILKSSEMERLQGVPVGYTKIIDRNNAASVLGNGWTVDVIAHIFKGLKQPN